MWFNENARYKWNDNKNCTLRHMFDRCHGSIEEAIAHLPAMIDNETWTSLLSTYKKNNEDDGSGMSKSEKCRAARMANDLDHRERPLGGSRMQRTFIIRNFERLMRWMLLRANNPLLACGASQSALMPSLWVCSSRSIMMLR